MIIHRKPNKLNFFQLVEILEDEYILNSAYTEESLPSVEHMAAQFGVSKVTVENAAKFLKQVGLLHSEIGRGTFINRTPPPEQKPEHIYMVSLDAFNPQNNFFHKQLSCELMKAATQRDLQSEYRYIADTHQKNQFVDLQRLVRTQGNAFIFLGDNADYQSLLKVLERQNRAYIHLGKTETADRPCLRSIITESNITASIQLGMEHLHNLGHRNIALLGVENSKAARMRIQAYRSFAQANLPDTELETLIEKDREPDIQAGHRILQNRLQTDRKFTALAALNDRLAAGALIALKDHGIRVPDEVSVVGYDNELGLVDDFVPTITSIGNDFGVMAESILARLLDNKPAADIPQQLFARESSGPAPQ